MSVPQVLFNLIGLVQSVRLSEDGIMVSVSGI